MLKMLSNIYTGITDFMTKIVFPEKFGSFRKIIQELVPIDNSFGKYTRKSRGVVDSSFELDFYRVAAETKGESDYTMYIEGDLLSYMAHSGLFGMELRSGVNTGNLLVPHFGMYSLIDAGAKALHIDYPDAAMLLLPAGYPPQGMTPEAILNRLREIEKKYEWGTYAGNFSH